MDYVGVIVVKSGCLSWSLCFCFCTLSVWYFDWASLRFLSPLCKLVISFAASLSCPQKCCTNSRTATQSDEKRVVPERKLTFVNTWRVKDEHVCQSVVWSNQCMKTWSNVNKFTLCSLWFIVCCVTLDLQCSLWTFRGLNVLLDSVEAEGYDWSDIHLSIFQF